LFDYILPSGPTFSSSLYPVYNDFLSPISLQAADRRARHRFALTLVLGFLLWLLLGLFIGVVGGEGAWWGDQPYRARWPGALEPIPLADGNVTRCADFLRTLPTSVIVVPPDSNKGHFIIPGRGRDSNDNDYMQRDSLGRGLFDDDDGDDGHTHTIYKSKVFFHIPIDGENGFFTLARGHYSSGPITYVLEEPKAPKDSPSDEDEVLHYGDTKGKSSQVEVEVVARWNDKELLKSSKVCTLSKHTNVTGGHHYTEYGIGIYTPSHDYPSQHRHLSFETVVRFPPSGLAKLRSLALEGPNFAPVDINLHPLTFDRADFNTSNGSIRAQSDFYAALANIRTSNGAIEGQFSIEDKLDLQSTNGRIDVNVNLIKKATSEEEKQDGQAMSKIQVNAHTNNGNVYINYLKHPQGVVLSSSARSTNGDAGVTHQPAFEGTFSVSNTKPYRCDARLVEDD
jgi:hypothetical protein